MLIINYLKNKNPDSLVVKLWENKKYHALICLFMYFIFFLILFIFIIIPYNKNNENSNVVNEKENIVTFDSMKLALLNSSYDYKYTVTFDSEKIIYSGNKVNNIYNGIKESQNGIIKYLINSDGTFMVNMDEMIPITNLYENQNENYFDLNYVLSDNFLTNEVINESENEINFNNEGVLITFKLDEKNILSININDNNKNYLLEFSNVR